MVHTFQNPDTEKAFKELRTFSPGAPGTDKQRKWDAQYAVAEGTAIAIEQLGAEVRSLKGARTSDANRGATKVPDIECGETGTVVPKAR